MQSFYPYSYCAFHVNHILGYMTIIGNELYKVHKSSFQPSAAEMRYHLHNLSFEDAARMNFLRQKIQHNPQILENAIVNRKLTLD